VARDKFSYQGLDPIADRIRRNAEDIGYLVVVDRTDRKHAETLGRFDLTEEAAQPYLEGEPDEEDEEFEGYLARPMGVIDEDEDLDDEDDDQEESEPEPPEPAEPGDDRGPMPMSLVAEAAIRWVKDIAARNTVGEEWRRYRVKVFGPKGIRQIDSGQFVCRNHDFDLDVPAADEVLRELRIPEPDLDRIEKAGMAKGIKALGDYYAQWGQIVLGSMGQLQGVNNAMLARMHRQLHESRGHVDELIAAMLESRIAESKLAGERRSEDHAADARTQLAQHALQQLGDAAKAFLASKGVSPEMADVLGVLGHSPELLGVLNDPEVRSLMNEPANLKALAAMLKQAAVQARAAREAANPTDPGADQAAAG